MSANASASKTSDELRESEARFRYIFDQSPVGSAIMGLDKRFIRCNGAFCRFLGYSEKELVGKTIADITYPEDIELGMKEMKQIGSGATESASIQKRYLRKDGQIVWGDVCFTLVRDERHNPLYLLPIIQDITARKQAEEDLAQHDDILRKLNGFSMELSSLPPDIDIEVMIVKRIKEFTGARVAIFSEYNPATRTTTPKHIEIESGLLEKAVSLLGKQVKMIPSYVTDEMYREMTTDIIGVRKTLFEASFGAVPRPVGAAIQALLDVDRFIGIAYIIEGKLYGTTLLAMGKGNPDPPKNLLADFISLAAISIRRKKAEDELLTEKRLLGAILENMPDQIYYKDRESRFIRCNPAVVFNCGAKSTEEVIGKTDFDFFQEDLARQYREDEQIIMKSGKPLINHEELTTNKITEVVRWNLTTKVPVKDSTGNVIGLIGINRDITRRKLIEEEIKLKNEVLLKLNSEKVKFYSIIAHDLRSPFNALLGLTRIMVDELPDLTLAEIQKIAFSINATTTNVFNLLENLLEWSRMQSGLTSFIPLSVLLTPVVTESLQSVLLAANKKEIDVSSVIANELTVFADVNMLESVIRNLVYNAVKFTPRGGKISISAETKAGNAVEISVRDTGIGMKQDMLGKLFHLDEQPSRKGTEGEPSTGLGLIICRDFIAKMGGTIVVESVLGRGSTFRFTLPAGTIEG